MTGIDFEQIVDRIHEAALRAHGIGRYRIREIEVDGRPLVAVQVWRREEGLAQTSDGRVLVRRGARNQAMIGEDLWHLMSSRALRRFERVDALGRQQVAHIKALHPRDDHYGMGCIEAAIAAASVHNRASRWNKALLDNAARPSGALGS